MSVKFFDRETLFRDLWAMTNRHNIIRYSQSETAKLVQVSYQRLSEIYLEFIDYGIMKKFHHRFQLKDPDTVDWDDFNEKATVFRKNLGR